MPTRRRNTSAGRRQDYRSASVGPNRPVGGRGQHVRRRDAVPGANDLNFQKARRSRRGTRGEISHITPGTRSGESQADFNRRTSQRHNITKNVERGNRIRTVLLSLVAILAAVFIAYNVGSCVYSNTLGDKMKLDDATVSQALVAPETADEPYYVLLAGCYWPNDHTNEGADMLALVRVDEPNKQATLVSIPGNLIYNTGRIGEVQAQSGDGALIEEVSTFAGVDIAHYVRIDSPSLVQMIDDMGGLELDVKMEVDDPDTGDIYIPSGTQTLSGDQALTLLRANNYANGDSDRSQNQLQFMITLTKRLLSEQGVGMMDKLANCIKTDYSSGDALGVLARFADADPDSFYTCQVPGSVYVENGKENFYMMSGQWQAMIDAVKEGKDPSEKVSVMDSLKPSDYSVEIRNGGGITGAGAEARSILKSAGFKTSEPTNTDTAAYDETLVIYKKDKYAAAAEGIVETLGVGRTVQDSVYYSFSKNVLVIVGRDWNYTG